MASSLGPVGDFQYRGLIDSSGAVILKVIKPFDVCEVVLRCTAAHVGGTITVQRSTDGTTFNAVSDAMTCAVDGAQHRSSSIITLQAVFNAGDYIRIVPAASAEAAVYIGISPKAIIGQ
jgi:hypothetical protein